LGRDPNQRHGLGLHGDGHDRRREPERVQLGHEEPAQRPAVAQRRGHVEAVLVHAAIGQPQRQAERGRARVAEGETRGELREEPVEDEGERGERRHFPVERDRLAAGLGLEVGHEGPEVRPARQRLEPHRRRAETREQRGRRQRRERAERADPPALEGKRKVRRGLEEEELVSSDYIGDPASCILDAKVTNVIDGTLITVYGWYDNEWGYASRCVDMLRFMGQRL